MSHVTQINKRLIVMMSLCILAVFVSACGPITAQEIRMVTPLAQAPEAVTEAETETPAPTATAEATPASDSPTAMPTATPTPLNVQLPQGSAAAIAMATDAAMVPDFDNPLTFDQSPVPITFDEFYAGFDMRSGITLSDKLQSLDGIEVVMEGYMAPPLKAELDWFVLTSVRLEFCPFCSTDADWPTDIAVVYLINDVMISTQAPVRIEGRMEIGSSIDPETGMVSLVRIYANEIEIL